MKLKPLKGLNAKLNAAKHGMNSKGLLPWEDPQEFEDLSNRWRAELKPRGMILEAGLDAIVMTQWKKLRNARSLPLYVACDPFGREVARHPGNWVENAQRLVNERDAKLSKLADFSATLLKVPESAPDTKRLRKAAEKIAKSNGANCHSIRDHRAILLGSRRSNAQAGRS